MKHFTALVKWLVVFCISVSFSMALKGCKAPSYISSLDAHYHAVPIKCGEVETVGLSYCLEPTVTIYSPDTDAVLSIPDSDPLYFSGHFLEIDAPQNQDGVLVFGVKGRSGSYTGVLNSFYGNLEYSISTVQKTPCEGDFKGGGACQVTKGTPLTFTFSEPVRVKSASCNLDATGESMIVVHKSERLYCPIVMLGAESDKWAVHYVSYYKTDYVPPKGKIKSGKLCNSLGSSKIYIYSGDTLTGTIEDDECKSFNGTHYYIVDEKNGRLERAEL